MLYGLGGYLAKLRRSVTNGMVRPAPKREYCGIAKQKERKDANQTNP